ncbi:MAG: hypothetical protein KQH67_11860 [Bacteroidetes bacterium]|nr:hypothetical protein [Bacteroidota bacterium]
MRKFIIIILGIIFYSHSFAQSADAFKYQAVIRDNSGKVISNSYVSFRISILSGSTFGDEVYAEKHLTQTDGYGMVNLDIGRGIPDLGSFNSINWGSDKHFIKLEFDEFGDENFELLGISQLLSVPYAMHANTVTYDQIDDADHDPENEFQQLNYNNNQLSISNGNSVELSSSPWKSNGASIYYNDGNVGIGLSNPNHKLVINDNTDILEERTFVKLSNKSLSSFSTVNLRLFAGENGSFTSLSHASETYTASPNQADFGQLWTSGAGLLLRANGGIIRLETSESGASIERIRIDKEGDVGIGTDDPKTRLQVADGDIYISDITKGVIMRSPDGQCWRMTVTNEGEPQFSMIECPE